MVPFVLRTRRRLPAEVLPGDDLVFDSGLQLWMNRSSGMPVVSEYAAQTTRVEASQFGETIGTRTREGVDQTERVSASNLGETIVTKTSEGIDSTERTSSLVASQFGETIHTATHEGVDQTEGTSRVA